MSVASFLNPRSAQQYQHRKTSTPSFTTERNQNEYKNPENNPMQSCRSFLYALVMVESDTPHIE